MPLTSSEDPDCPFCAIAAAYPPIEPPLTLPESLSSPKSSLTLADVPNEPLAYLLLSTPHILAFLDHAPISKGHVLVATRHHRVKLSDASIEESSSIGAWLGILSRAVVRAVSGTDTDSERTVIGGLEETEVGDWNIVQNNGPRAAQIVPHVHFHIIPRTDDVPSVKARSWTVFGKGQREDLDNVQAEDLTRKIRKGIKDELELLAVREGIDVARALVGNDLFKKEKSKL